MMNKTYRVLSQLTALAFLAFEGTIAHAQTSGSTLGTNLAGLITFIDKYIVPLIFALAFIVFLWGVFQYFILGGANDEKRKEGRMFILYAIIGFVIMVCIWGIINLLKDSLG